MSKPGCPSSKATPQSKSNRSSGSVLLVTDPKYVNVLYSYSDRGAYRIDVGPAVSDLAKGEKEAKGSDVTWLVDTHPLQISRAGNYKVAEASSIAPADGEQRILKTAFVEPEILRKGLPTLPKIVALGGAPAVYPNFVTEEALRVFGKRVMLLRENAQQLINSGMQMSKHLTTQQSELAMQAVVMQRAHERLESYVTPQGDSLKERLERLADLISAEVKWIEEVEGLEKVVNERVNPVIAQLTKQHQTLQKEKEKMHGIGDGNGRRKSVVQTRKIKDALRMEYDLLIETTKKLEKVQLGVEEATIMVAKATEASGSDVVSALKEA
ncbi:hypothetical protein BJ742DRAFT_911583 [Cladochytrium replicatum]|nr:hypothetical protein BJ742DRAFT_911583 [Cladochytrium replicatum]